MFIIPCPYCGDRSQEEFKCGGESAIQRPPFEVSDEKWAQYLFIRKNPKGWLYERWVHIHGCGEWFNLLRHTVSHEIKGPFEITHTIENPLDSNIVSNKIFSPFKITKKLEQPVEGIPIQTAIKARSNSV